MSEKLVHGLGFGVWVLGFVGSVYYKILKQDPHILIQTLSLKLLHGMEERFGMSVLVWQPLCFSGKVQDPPRKIQIHTA